MINQQAVSTIEILNALDRGVTVVTGNKRLAGAIRQTFEKTAMAKGLEAWSTPDILPWTVWLQRCWTEAVVKNDALTSKYLLSPQQEHRLWEDIVTECLTDQPLLHTTGSANQAQQAWQLIQSWRIPLDQAVFNYNSDSAAFWEWASIFETKCSYNRWLSMAGLANELQSCFLAATFNIPSELILIGFDELTPQQQLLLQTLVESGCDVHWMQISGKQPHAIRIECIDARQEAAIVAHWVRQRLDDNPGSTIGIVVPDLASQRDIVTHSLDEMLAPNALLPGNQSIARPYNISLGIPLSEYPIINTALNLLGLLQPMVSLRDAGNLLRSPFIAGWEQEASARALLDKQLRQTGELNITLTTLRHLALQSTKPYSCPVLADNLGGCIQLAKDCSGTGSPAQWSERVAGLLKVIGWANGRPLSSDEYQVTQAWHDLLLTFSTLELVTRPMTIVAAITLLRHLAMQQTFQPHTNAARVQVLGMLETNCLQFDCIWIMGLNDNQWPSSPQPNPFIPLYLQRDLGLPHSSEERELQVSRIMTDRMISSATETIASYPVRKGDERFRPSPLIHNLPIVTSEHLNLKPVMTWKSIVRHSAKLTKLATDPAPPLEIDSVKGGSAVFKLQAACPFRAFAELRLTARALDKPEIGLNALVRGSLMHSILEKVWDALVSHEHLIEKDDVQLLALVQPMVSVAIDEISNKLSQPLAGRFREIESERLCNQVLEWLEIEKQREAFLVIEKEQKHQARAGGICVQLKIDRVDELSDGRQLVINYKTGNVQPSQWFGERPNEPQLPLYSLAINADIAGVVFAQVKAGGMAFNGVTAQAGLLPGVKSYEKLSQTRDAGSWSAVLNDWQSTMENLGEAYRHGDASVDPKQGQATCKYCELQALCRIDELTEVNAVLTGDSSETENP